jgi:hypothetical protein
MHKTPKGVVCLIQRKDPFEHGTLMLQRDANDPIAITRTTKVIEKST